MGKKRNLIPARKSVCSEHPWSLWIWTSDLPNAGTDAEVYFQVYGEKGKSDELILDNKTDNFEQGQVDRFMESITLFHPYNHSINTELLLGIF